MGVRRKIPVAGMVSVIIPCHNHEKFLAKAIRSALTQEVEQVEVIVVDDGSTDGSKAVAQGFAEIQYVYQKNGGPSSARNLGIDHSKGEFLVFLDADDWLVEGALSTNVHYLQRDRQLAFVSGAYQNFYENNKLVLPFQTPIEGAHYLNLLQRNYISMIAAVMFRREVLEQYRFDPSLRTCEDYDLYLRIAKEHPVYHHQEFIAVYRFHETNTIYHFREMLKGSLKALSKQKVLLTTDAEKDAWAKGIYYWKRFYAEQALESLFASLAKNDQKGMEEEIELLWEYSKPMYLQFLKAKSWKWVKSFYKK
jgi:glycosyltransferase involved in cell wall biosynthesis